METLQEPDVQKALPVGNTTGQTGRTPRGFGGSRPGGALTFDVRGVSDGARTRDNRDHNPVLYQLSYTHHGAVGEHTGSSATGVHVSGTASNRWGTMRRGP